MPRQPASVTAKVVIGRLDDNGNAGPWGELYPPNPIGPDCDDFFDAGCQCWLLHYGPVGR